MKFHTTDFIGRPIDESQESQITGEHAYSVRTCSTMCFFMKLKSHLASLLFLKSLKSFQPFLSIQQSSRAKEIAEGKQTPI